MSTIHSTGFFTQAFTGLFHSEPAVPTSRSLTQVAVFEIAPVISSSGRRTATAITLKKSCTVAAANARLNSAGCLMWPSDTRVLVTVVPMFAPMIIGIAASTLMPFVATSPTITDVEADDDWTSTVPRMPTQRPAIGLLTLENKRSCVSSPMILMPFSRAETPTRKV